MFPHFVHYFSEGRESFYSNIRLYALTNTWTQQDRNDSVVTIWKNSSNIGHVPWGFPKLAGTLCRRVAVQWTEDWLVPMYCLHLHKEMKTPWLIFLFTTLKAYFKLASLITTRDSQACVVRLYRYQSFIGADISSIGIELFGGKRGQCRIVYSRHAHVSCSTWLIAELGS